MRYLIAITLLCSAILATEQVSAYTLLDSDGSRWLYNWEDGEEVHWVMNSAGCPDMTVDRSAEILEASFQTWEDVDCATVSFVYDGTVDQDITGNDGVNLMVWRTSGWVYGMGALGVTGCWFGMGRITDADIEYNSQDYTWSETGQGGTMDLQSVATHENGHFLGLGHSDVWSAVMSPTYTGGTSQRFLDNDDRAGVCYLYPAEGGGCTSDAECPSGHVCQAGDCVPAGNGDVCSPCSGHEQCGEAADLCIPYPNDISRCGRACTQDEDCSTVPGCGARICSCEEVSGGSQHQCVAAGFSCAEGPECEEDEHCEDHEECIDEHCVERGCITLGKECSEPDDCCSDICIDGLCSQSCDWLEPADSCPDGFYCMIQECGVGVCLPGHLGSGSRGSECHSHDDCMTGYCSATGGPTSCNIPCNPHGINTCPEEESCIRIGGSNCGLCACQFGQLGDPCEERGQCASGTCVTKSEERRCSRFCSDTNPCPDGYSCLDAGTQKICWLAQGSFGSECEREDDCAEGPCVEGQCTRTCETDCDCVIGYRCEDVDGDNVCVEGLPRHRGGGNRFGCNCAIAKRNTAPSSCVSTLLLALVTFFLTRPWK